MPRVKLPITEWLPAQGAMLNPGVIGVSEAIPLNGSWTLSPRVSFTKITSPSTYSISQLYGFHIHSVASSVSQKWFFAGTNDKLLRGSAADSVTMGTAIAAATFSTPDADSGWQFSSFGNAIYATNGNFTDPIQYAATPSTDFVKSNIVAAPVSYDPLCKYMTTIKNHLLIGNIKFAAAPSASLPQSALTTTDYPYMVMWSATDAPRRFGDPKAAPEILGSDYQDILDDYGPVTGMSGGDFAYIFKPRAVYVMEGPPWTFRPICIGIGTVYCNSIVRYFDDCFFWTPSGPVRIGPGKTEPEFIAQNKLYPILTDQNLSLSIPHTSESSSVIAYTDYSSIYSSIFQNAINVSGWCDTVNGLICWSFDPRTTLADGKLVGSMIFVYSIKDDRWGFFQYSAEPFAQDGRSVVFVRSHPAHFLQRSTLDSAYFLGGPDNSNIGVGQFLMSSGSDRLPAHKGTTIKTGFFSLPIADSMESEKQSQASRIIKIRPIYSMKYGEDYTVLSVELTVNSFTRFPDANGPHTVTISALSSASYQQGEGWVSVNGPYALYHQIEISILDDSLANARYLTDFKAIEIEYAVMSGVGSTNKG